MDIRDFIMNEIARDYSESDIQYSIQAFAGGKAFVPSQEDLTCTISINNEYKLPLQAEVHLINPEDRQLFTQFPDTLIDGIVDELRFDFRLKLEADANAEALGKEIPVRVRLINPQNTNDDFGIKKFSIRCNTAPPVIPEALVALKTSTSSGGGTTTASTTSTESEKYAVVFCLPDKADLATEHCDINELVIVKNDGNTEVVPVVIDSSGNLTFTNSSTSISNYTSNGYAKLNVDLPTKTDNFFTYDTNDDKSVSEAERKIYGVYLRDSQGLYTNVSCSTKLLKLLFPIVKDSNGVALTNQIEDFGTDLGEDILLFPSEEATSTTLTLEAPTHAFFEEDYEEVASPVTLKYTLTDIEAAGTGIEFPYNNSGIEVEKGVYKLKVSAIANGYVRSDVSYRVTLQNTVWLKVSNGDDKNYGQTVGQAIRTTEAAVARINALQAKNPNVPITLTVAENAIDLDNNAFANLKNVVITLSDGVSLNFNSSMQVSGSLTLKNLTIDVPIDVEAGGSLLLGDTFKLENVDVSTEGSSVINNAGTLVMDNDASISNCSSKNGGIVNNTGTFTMKDNATIKNSNSYNGGAVYNTGTFNMEGKAAIENCYADKNANVPGNAYEPGKGGGVYNTGTFNMSGGEIRNCGIKKGTPTDSIETTDGGGVYNAAGGTFNFSGGGIYNNICDDNDKSKGHGGGIKNYGTCFIWGGANIGEYVDSTTDEKDRGNIGGNCGGGIYNANGAELYLGFSNASTETIWNGKCQQNTSHEKATDGIYLESGSFCIFASGNILNNTYVESGTIYSTVGIYVCHGASFTMKGTAYVHPSNGLFLGSNSATLAESVDQTAGKIQYAKIKLDSYVGTNANFTRIAVDVPKTFTSGNNTGASVLEVVVIESGATEQNIKFLRPSDVKEDSASWNDDISYELELIGNGAAMVVRSPPTP